MTLKPAHLTEEQRKILCAVALAYRRVMRAPGEVAETRADAARKNGKRPRLPRRRRNTAGSPRRTQRIRAKYPAGSTA